MPHLPLQATGTSYPTGMGKWAMPTHPHMHLSLINDGLGRVRPSLLSAVSDSLKPNTTVLDIEMIAWNLDR